MIAIQVSFDSSSECTGLCHSISEAGNNNTRQGCYASWFGRLNARSVRSMVDILNHALSYYSVDYYRNSKKNMNNEKQVETNNR